MSDSDAKILNLAHGIANWWLDNSYRVRGLMPVPWARLMDELEELTSGDIRRCCCCSRNHGHTMQCRGKPR